MSYSSNTRRGVNTSLYQSLSEEAINWIELTIWFRMIGHVDSARRIFDDELKSLATTHIVIIERANLEHEAGRWGQAWRILDTALVDLKRARADLDLPEYRLMALMWAMFGVRHRGDLIAATRELERARCWLCQVRVADYSDIQASCVRYYTIAYLLTRLSSNFQDDAMENIPLSVSNDTTGKIEPWAGLRDLRRSLVHRGMFYEANALFRVELNRTPLADRDPIVREFLSQVTSMGPKLDKAHIESSVRLQWSISYVEMGNAARAVEELTAADVALGTWCKKHEITDAWVIPQFHALICAQLALNVDEPSKLDLTEQIAGVLEKKGSCKTGTILSAATETASALYQETGKSEYLEIFFALHERLETYDEDYSEDLCDLVIHRNDLISLTSTNLVDRQKSLEWIDGFLQRYPFFAPPGELESLHRRRSILLRGLQRLEDSTKAEEEADRLKRQGPSFGRWLHTSFGNTTKLRESAPQSTRYEDEEEDEEEEVFFQAWTAVVGNQEKVVNTAIDLVHRWAAEDENTGYISLSMYHKLVGIPDHSGTTSDTCVQHSQECFGEGERLALLTALTPPDEVAAETYKERWHLIAVWLENPPQGQRMKRLFCLLMLRDARQYKFSDNHLWDLRIQELEQIIDFHSRLPPGICAVTRAQNSGWLAALASTYMAQLEGAPTLSDPSVYALLSKAEQYCDMAIEELRKNYQPGPVLIQQRLGAQICLLKISRLEERLAEKLNEASSSPDHGQSVIQPGAEELCSTEKIEHEIALLRKLGLAKVEESEQISTASELEASWVDGLDGVRERQKVLEFQASFWTVQNAIHLLLKERDRSQETITEVWNWVQKYKARSLARTIGTRSDIPPGLLSQIHSSQRASSLFQEMLDLEEKIEATPHKARFELRRKLDRIRHRMKQDSILRRLIDLREGSPLNVTDVAAIQEGASQPIVLVDFFYLPPYPDGTIGRLLLLTVRANGEPTMDVLSTSIEDVQAWQKEFLDPQKLSLPGTRHEFNKRLGGLVAPLLHRSKKNEVLVLCPSTTLHRLPLHALHVLVQMPGSDDAQSQPLIHRNPVVYIHSLSLLRSSFAAAQHAQHSPQKINPQFLAGISEAAATAIVNGRQSNYTAGRESIRGLAGMCNTLPMIDDSASKTKFKEVMTRSRLLHLHTHCNWQFADPLDHHVEFPDNHGSVRSQENKDLKLTAKEIFELGLLPGTHVNLIACQGGLLEVRMGDEVMGLVPALLFSGATSTVSTLWNIADQDGARFSRLFFESFFDQCEEQTESTPESVGGVGSATSSQQIAKSCSFADIAIAMQDAITQMDPNWHESLYHWAGFVLHGYWIYSVSFEDLIHFSIVSSSLEA